MTYADGTTAWDPEGATDRYAYLVIAAVPQIDVDPFEITVTNDGQVLSIFESGYGNPPINDPNSLPSHGIYDTWFEVYQFQFDGPLTTIGNVQPGQTGTSQGRAESFDIDILSTHPDVMGLHIDLFTVTGSGVYEPGGTKNPKLVKRFAPFSHDGYIEVGRTVYVPESGTGAVFLVVMGALLTVAARMRRRENPAV